MTTKEQIEVMHAFEDGKEIESKWHDEDDGWSEVTSPVWNWSKCDYRVKQEPKYRPYKDTEEMINDFCTRFGVKRTSYGEPFIWVKYNGNGDKRLIQCFSANEVSVSGFWKNVEDLGCSYTYLDGSPCGVRE